MRQPDLRFWMISNAVLALVIIALLIYVLIGQRRNGCMPVLDDSEGAGHVAVAMVAPLEVHRAVAIERVGGRPVSFSRMIFSTEVTEGWRVRGVEPQEWARLPASPGMDMAEMPDAYQLTFSLPGVRQNDIHLCLTGSVVTVQAVVRDMHGDQVGGIERRVRLPRTPNDPAEFKSLFTNGVLRISVTK